MLPSEKQNPSKYENLLKLKGRGLNTPPSLLIQAKDLDTTALRLKVAAFIKRHPGRYIVRSAVSAEGGQKNSLAGHFYSSGAVLQGDLQETIKAAWFENQTKVKTAKIKAEVNLMVQPFYQSIKGGVAFTQWQYFKNVYVVSVSKTPQQAVSGINTQTLLVDKNTNLYFGTIKEVEQNILKALVETLVVIEKHYGAMDIEWLYTKEDGIIILQMRPITVAPGFLTPANKRQTSRHINRFKKISSGPWQQNELSQNLGALSPLSFSLIEQLYKSCAPALQAIGLSALDLNWLQRADNGQVYCDIQSYGRFFSYKHWWSPLKLSYKQTFKWQEINAYLKTYVNPKEFQISQAQEIFNYWMVANVYLALQKGSVLPESATFGDYELANPDPFLNTNQYSPDCSDWAQVCFNLKIIFFKHLELLKGELKEQSSDYLQTWEAFQNLGVKAASSNDIDVALNNSSYYLPANFEKNKIEKRIFLTNSQDFEGTIWKPRSQIELPENAIYCDEVFDNRFVALIPNLKGIIVRSGSPLAHSAIVAREHNVPYIMDDIDLYKAGCFVSVSNA